MLVPKDTLHGVWEHAPTAEQELKFKKIMADDSTQYRFTTAEQIACLGMDIEAEALYEWIGDHTKKILQENENQLIKIPGTGKIFSVDL